MAAREEIRLGLSALGISLAKGMVMPLGPVVKACTDRIKNAGTRSSDNAAVVWMANFGDGVCLRLVGCSCLRRCWCVGL